MSHVGPISFSHPKPRAQLVHDGEVVTFRSKRTTGETWANWKRGTTKKADVTVSEITKVNPSRPSHLEPHADISGFGSVEGWQEAIRDLHGGGSYPEYGFLYHVGLRKLVE